MSLPVEWRSTQSVSAPSAYLRGLVDRVSAGDFTPEASLRIADKRKRQQQVKASQYRAETIHRKIFCDGDNTVNTGEN